jgi:hypothetical protein
MIGNGNQNGIYQLPLVLIGQSASMQQEHYVGERRTLH